MDMFFVYVYVFVAVIVVVAVVVDVVVIVVGIKWNANDAYALLCIFWQKTFAGAGAEPVVFAQLCCTVHRKELVCIFAPMGTKIEDSLGQALASGAHPRRIELFEYSI